MDSTQIANIKRAADELALALSKEEAARETFMRDPVEAINRFAPILITGFDAQQIEFLATQLKKDKYLTGIADTKLGDKIRCWSCRIGMNAGIVGLGTGVVAGFIAAGVLTGGFATEIITFLVAFSVDIAVATGILQGALAFSATGIVGVTEALVELTCDAIPHTCG